MENFNYFLRRVFSFSHEKIWKNGESGKGSSEKPGKAAPHLDTVARRLREDKVLTREEEEAYAKRQEKKEKNERIVSSALAELDKVALARVKNMKVPEEKKTEEIAKKTKEKAPTKRTKIIFAEGTAEIVAKKPEIYAKISTKGKGVVEIAALTPKVPEKVIAETKYFRGARTAVRSEALVREPKFVTAEDSVLFKALVMSAGGQEAWDKFKKDYALAKREGELKTGSQIEDFQRAWVETHCGRQDIYADMAQLKASMGLRTNIEYAKAIKEDYRKGFDRLGYEVANAFGLDGIAMTGKEVTRLYNIAGLPEGFGGKGSEIVFDPKIKNIQFLGSQGQSYLVCEAPAEKTAKEYIAQLKKEKGIEEKV